MSIYRFSDDSPIASITFRYVNGEPTVALIEASKTATAEDISAAKKMLGEKGMSLVPVIVDESGRLQVSGFLTEQTVIDTLAAQNTVKGIPEITEEASDLPPPPKSKFKTFLDKVKDKYSWRLAGALNLIGDVSMHLDGYSEIRAKVDKKTGNPLTPEQRKASVTSGVYDLIGGGLYTAGGLNAAAFGNSKHKAPPLADRTTDFIAHTANPQDHPLDPTKKPGNFLQRHAADVTLASYTAGAGVFLTKGASSFQKLGKELLSEKDPAKIQKLQDKRKQSASLMTYGIWSLICKMLSLFTKEKPKSEEDKPKSNNPIMRVVNWFREKPLRIFGLGNLISETLYARYTYRTYKSAKVAGEAVPKSEYMFKVVTTLAYYMSDFFSAISSKNLISKPLDADGERDVIARAAQSIAKQPQEKRDELVSKTVQFLSEQPEIQHSGKKSITASLKNHIEHLDSNPWANRIDAAPAAELAQPAR